MESKQLMRSTSDKMVAGVASGLAKYFNVNAILMRIIFVLLGFWGPGILLYIILWLIMPEDTSVASAPPAEPPAE
jgi:phage shock protein C